MKKVLDNGQKCGIMDDKPQQMGRVRTVQPNPPAPYFDKEKK